MRSRLSLLAVACSVLGSSAVTAQDFLDQNVPAQPTFVPGEIIVKMRTGGAIAANRLLALGLDSAVQTISGVAEYVYQMPPTAITAMGAAVARDRTMALVDSLRADPNVEYAQPNYRVYAVGRPTSVRRVRLVPNDPRFTDQWHYRNNGTGSGESPGGINLPDAWDTTTGSTSIVVAILDTGILPLHEDIQPSGHLVTGFDMISDPFIANDGDGRDADPTDPGDAIVVGECDPGPPPSPPVNLPNSWHGTHVAGTVGVGATNNNLGVSGVNWNVSVQAVRVLGKCGGSTSDINDAIRWAAGLAVPGVPNNTTPARVISMSLGTPPGLPCSLSPSTQSAINDAVAAGALVVVAAGNDHVDASQVFPASCDNVVTVAASGPDGALVTDYSNFGTTVEIMAPGGDKTPTPENGVLSMVQGGSRVRRGRPLALRGCDPHPSSAPHRTPRQRDAANLGAMPAAVRGRSAERGRRTHPTRLGCDPDPDRRPDRERRDHHRHSHRDPWWESAGKPGGRVRYGRYGCGVD
jgi:serine protease